MEALAKPGRIGGQRGSDYRSRKRARLQRRNGGGNQKSSGRARPSRAESGLGSGQRLRLGENPFPGGYALLPVKRIAHVHAKDCTLDGHKPIWGALGECDIDWKGQIDALARDGYTGYINLETHWPGPGGDKHEASMICGRNLLKLVESPATLKHVF